jgi:UDP-glucose 4-epimerase
MKTIVTGGAGFIGSHLSELLIANGHEVLVVDNLTSGRLENVKAVANHPRFKFANADIRDPSALQPLFDGADWVFHLAGLADIVPSIEMPSQYYSTNVSGTFNVLECARRSGVKRFLYAASSSSYGIPDQYPTPESAPIQPQYPYALTKYMGEELVLHWAKVYKFPTVSLRLFNVF